MSDVILYAALKENQRLNTELLTLKTGGGGAAGAASTTPDILYNCNGCWNGSAEIPEANRGVYTRYEIVGSTNYWIHYCSSLNFGFAGACSGSCQDNFAQYCCTHCSCGWIGDVKCNNGTQRYDCAGTIPWIFGCSSGCMTACRQGGMMWNIGLAANNACCGGDRGFHYCSATSNNGSTVMCCSGVRNSGYGYSCCGGEPSCLKSICLTTQGSGNPFGCQANVTIMGYGKITP